MICDRKHRREVVLWNIEPDERYITETIKENFMEDIPNYLYYGADHKIPDFSISVNYLLFYVASDKVGEKRVREYAKNNKLNISFVALCKDDQAGIMAMRKGDFYALRLPLEQEKIISCYTNFIKESKGALK